MALPKEARLPIDITTARYELERFHARITFSDSVLRHIKLESHRTQASGHLVQELIGIVAIWRKERLLKTPANWWEHLKQRWYPAWALSRWPVLYTYHDAAVILPRVPVVNPEYHTVEFPVWRERE